MPEAQAIIKQIAVVGGGIVGACSALELLARGFHVTIIDKGDKKLGASYGNGGTISPFSCIPVSMPGGWRSVPKWLLDPDGPLVVPPSHFLQFLPWGIKFLLKGREANVHRISEAMAALSRGNMGLYANHLQGTGSENLLRESCYILAYRDPSAISTEKLDYKLRLKIGAQMEIADSKRLHELEPDLSSEFKAALVMHNQGRAFSPGELRDALIGKAIKLGAVLHTATVKALRPDADHSWVVMTDRGTVRASSLLVAAGAWSRELLRTLGVKVPLEYEYGYHVEVQAPGVTINNTIMDTGSKLVTSSMMNGIRASSFADFRKPGLPVNHNRSKILVRHLSTMFPELKSQSYTEWGGPRPSFPDSLPAIGEVPGHHKLYVAFGHSHFGLGMAPRTGQLIGQLLSGGPTDVSLAPYSISRF